MHANVYMYACIIILINARTMYMYMCMYVMFCSVDERAAGEIEECHDVQCRRIQTTSKPTYIHMYSVMHAGYKIINICWCKMYLVMYSAVPIH